MDLFVLIGQRKCRYEGEYAPEALAVIDEYGNDENPDYMRDTLAEHRSTGDFDALAVIHLTFSGKAVQEALYPAQKPIAATVVAAG